MDRQTILVVDDSGINRRILRRLLQDEYDVLEAENGQVALEFLESPARVISAVLLDLVMPVMDGYAFLSALRKTAAFGVPVIVTTGNSAQESEEKAFNLGAWDFVSKPYKPQILRYRLQSAIARSENEALKKVKQLSEHDTLTGLHNRNKFFETTRKMLDVHPELSFAFIRFDINRFSLINTFFGNDEGDRLLKYMANRLSEFVTTFPFATYGRIEADQFAMCCCYKEVDRLRLMLERANQAMLEYPLDFAIVLTFGVYLITDRCLPVRQMLDNASLAAKQAKGHYSNNIVFYDEEMGRQMIAEQAIINEMNEALKKEQFCLYIQPKYDLYAQLPAGGEALVRWNHPTKGIITPGEIIPIFEKSGFIAKLDYYVWEKACIQLEQWQQRGLPAFPLSVNVSRVHLYNPQLADVLCDMTDKHHVPHHMLNLEITESIYTEHPTIIQESIARLHQHGFIVMMDDFGSGYSSLNVLKDVEFDVLKIDMRFFESAAIVGRGESIVASIIRMAKWLGVPIIAEGVETQEQVSFLRDMGYEFVQGYFFARPMIAPDYEELIGSHVLQPRIEEKKVAMDAFWKDNTQMELLFSTMPQPIVLYEFSENHLELIRVNQAFYHLFGHDELSLHPFTAAHHILSPEDTQKVLGAFQQAVESRNVGECDYLRRCADGQERWIHLHLQYMNQSGSRHILLGILWDISYQAKLSQELIRYQLITAKHDQKQKIMLIVDNVAANRTVLVEMFKGQFRILQAENGEQALELLESGKYEVDIILLELIMPVMDGTTFLMRKREIEQLRDIPVVIITVDDDPVHQINTLALGANDYIAKPFVKETVVKRVHNVLESSVRFAKMFEEYNHMVELSKKDGLTGVYNRTATEALVNHHIESNAEAIHGFLVLDVDNFKTVNDLYGHIYGDAVLKETAQALVRYFRTGDIVGRLGGDEFAVFLPGMSSERLLLKKAKTLCAVLQNTAFTDRKLTVSASIGVCLSSPDSNFMELYGMADAALYKAKQAGKVQARLYQKEKEELKR